MSAVRFRFSTSAAVFVVCIILAACAKTQKFEISPSPGDSLISVDGSPVGTGAMEQPIKFKNAADAHTITASHVGYRDKTVTVSRDDPADVELILGPLSRKLTFNVTPVPGVISIDGHPVSPDPLASTLQELNFSTDAHQQWTKYTVTASRPGFLPAKVEVNFTDESPVYTLQLQPMRKDISITTNPPAATVVFDSDNLGKSPVTYPNHVFAYDVDANQFLQHTIRLTKPGYEPVQTNISWDDGRTDYSIVMPPRKKTVHIVVTPVGASAIIDGQAVATDSDGVATVQLTYVPTDEIGTMPVHTAVISKKTAKTEWAAVNLPIGWDDGKTDYSVMLKEIKTTQVLEIRLDVARNADGVWEVGPATSLTKAMKDASEGSGNQPVPLYTAAPGTSIGSLAVSPSGLQMLFTLLSGQTKADFRSQIEAIGTVDGSNGGVAQITDGKALDVQPTYTPAGDQIVFASNRAGKRLNIWRKALQGGPGIEQLTNNDEQDLWPMIDATPKARLFYQALSDSQNEAQLYVAPVDGGPRMDVATTSIQQPRVSPKADAILFTSVNQRTGNREIYRIPDKGGPATNLTIDPDNDYYDPAWSHDGTKIAFVSNRGLDEDRNHNADIWIMDLAHANPIQVTSNGSVDDCPVWDPAGNAIYFRSNRGGQWGIWRISLQ